MAKILILFIFISISSVLFCQTEKDKNEIYTVVFSNLTKIHPNQKVLIIDSTYHSLENFKINSEDYKAYFNIDNSDSILSFRTHFIEYSKQKDAVKINNLNTSNYLYFSGDSLKKLHEKYHDNINSKLYWSFIYDTLKCDGYCGFTRPFFYNQNTVIIYQYHIFGGLSGGGFIYILKRINGEWKIVAERWQWIS
jgi:hypothetical protein